MNQVKLEISIYIISLHDIKIIMQRTDQRFLITLECRNYHTITLYLLQCPLWLSRILSSLENRTRNNTLNKKVLPILNLRVTGQWVLYTHIQKKKPHEDQKFLKHNRLGRALRNLVLNLPMTGGWNWMVLNVLSNPNLSGIPISAENLWEKQRYSSCLELPLFYLVCMEGHFDFSSLILKITWNGSLNGLNFPQPCFDGKMNPAASWHPEIFCWCSYSPLSFVPPASAAPAQHHQVTAADLKTTTKT